jgi:NitT/TauT family transport system permease protein
VTNSSDQARELTPGEKIIAEWRAPTRAQQLYKSLEPMAQLGKLLVILAFIVLWWQTYEQGWINPSFIGSPSGVWTWFVDNWDNGEVWRDIRVTLSEAFWGWILGSSTGLLAGLVVARYRFLWKITSPLFTFFNAVPRTALAPIFILWFGIAQTGKILLAASIVFFIVMIPTRAAADMVDPDLDMVMITMGGTERHRFLKVTLPSVLTSVFGAIRLASVWALLGASYAELFGAKYGLGLRYIAATNVLNMSEAFAVTAVIAFLAIIINALVGLLEKRLMRWQSNSTKGSVLTI